MLNFTKYLSDNHILKIYRDIYIDMIVQELEIHVNSIKNDFTDITELPRRCFHGNDIA